MRRYYYEILMKVRDPRATLWSKFHLQNLKLLDHNLLSLEEEADSLCGNIRMNMNTIRRMTKITGEDGNCRLFYLGENQAINGKLYRR